MKKILILVEGPTEEAFVKKILADYLTPFAIHIVPVLVSTKRVKTGIKFKGGVVSYQKVRSDLIRLFQDSSADIITTMIDYYGLPNDFPGKTDARGTPYKKVDFVEKAFQNDINHPRFRSYLNLHEYEGLLFSSPAEIAKALHEPSKEIALQRIRDGFTTPEEINDDPQAAPSKRILKILPAYSKPHHGPLIFNRIGLNAVRSQCPHFDQWVSDLEKIT